MDFSLEDEVANEILRWRQKKEIERLEGYIGHHTSLVTLLIPPNTPISKASKMIASELTTAPSIKSRENRQSVMGALTSISHRLRIMA